MIFWLFCTRHLREMPVYKKEEASKNTAPAVSGLYIGAVILLTVTAISAIGNGFLKDTVTTWLPALLYEEFGLPEAFSVIITLVLPLSSFLGTMLHVFLRRYVPSHTLLMGLLYTASALSLIGVLLARSIDSILLTILCFALNSCLMAAVNNIITFIIPMEQKNSGMCAGVMDAFATSAVP